MRILVDCHCFDGGNTEGINTYIQGIYSELVVMMPEADFFFAAADTDRLRHIFGTERVNVHYVTLKNRRRIGRMLLEYPRIVKRYGIDFAHFQYFSPPLLGCKSVVTLHDVLFKDYPDKFPLGYRMSRSIVFGHSARHADLFTTVSEYSRRRISANFGIAEEKILLTRNGVSADWFDISTEESQAYRERRGLRRYILYVSRIEPRKNHLELLRACCDLNLSERGYDLVFVSQQTLPVAEFDRYLASLPTGVREHVHLLEAVDRDEIKLLYGGAELFVYPSLAEGFGIPPIEAAAAGVPVICHNSTAMSEFSFFGDNLIDVTAEGALRQAIERNLAERPTDLQLSAISDTVRRNYSWNEAARQLRFAFLRFL